MFINCPNCSALVATDLASGLPPEHCPRCGFGPLAELPGPLQVAPPAQPDDDLDDVPGAGPDAAADAAAPSVPVSAPAAMTTPAPQQSRPGGSPASVTGAASVTDPRATAGRASPSAPQGPAPRFLQRHPSGVPLYRRDVAAIAALAVLLATQLLLADRARLSADAAWRPLLSTVCAVLGCSLPPWREPAAIAVQHRDVRPRPHHPGVLRVSASIRNDARWAQAWPRLTLTLSDIDGRALGMRTFGPAEYLGGPPPEPTLASGGSAAIGVDIVEPSPHAVAFDFRFD